MKIAKAVFLGKSVLRTDRVETPWIHFAGLIAKGFKVNVDVDDNIIYHFQITDSKVRAAKDLHTFIGSEKPENLLPFKPIPKEEIQSMNETFNLSFANLKNFKSNFIYADIIFEYFSKHGNWEDSSCITPLVAQFPKNITNFECVVARRNFSTKYLNNNTAFYVPKSNFEWEENKEKCEIFEK
uniref:Uncharacterized protein n=1 Tax=Panagrolaimus davidi TaxID=227884 RepID=A0A914QCJ0_9BILA